MPASVVEEVGDLLDTAEAHDRDRSIRHLARFARLVDGRTVQERVAVLQCPACGSSHVAQMLGDNGGVSYVCTACGHSWS